MGKDVLQYLIIIVAAIVWIVSKVSKVTKPAKIDTSTPPPVFNPKQSRDLDDWWKEISTEVKPVTVPKPAVKEIKVKNQPIDRVDPDYFDKLHNNYKNPEFTLKSKPLRQLEIIDNFDKTENSVKHLDINLKHSNEVRRAFVYSEIFNRKY